MHVFSEMWNNFLRCVRDLTESLEKNHILFKSSSVPNLHYLHPQNHILTKLGSTYIFRLYPVFFLLLAVFFVNFILGIVKLCALPTSHHLLFRLKTYPAKN